MMDTKKQLQTGSLLKKHISEILQQEGIYIYGSRVLVTVTDVKLSPDLSNAKVYLSVFNAADKNLPVAQVAAENVRLRGILGTRIRNRMRHIPTLNFYLDDTLDEVYKVEAIFEKLHKDNQMGDGRPEIDPMDDEYED